MYKYIFRKAKKNLSGYILLSIGYIISIIIISLNVSLTQNAIKLSIDNSYGIAKHQSTIKVQSKSGIIDYNNLTAILKNNTKTTRIEINGIEDYFNLISERPTQVYVIPFAYNEEPEWMPNQLKGRFFSSAESISNDKVAVIGNILASQYFPKGVTNNSYIKLGDDDFKVVGIVGREELGVVDYGRNIYIPLGTLPSKYSNNLNNITINFLVNGKTADNIKDNVVQQINKENGQLEIIDQQVFSDTGKVSLSLLTTITISAVILFISVTNMASFTVWQVLKRRKEMAISKLLGATNRVLSFQIFIEAIVVAFIAAFIAMLIQSRLTPFIIDILKGNFMISDFKVSIYNWMISIGIAVFISLITSIISFRQIVKLKPTEEIKIE